MEPRTLYLETSVWGSLGKGQPRDRKRVVRQLLELLGNTASLCVVSEVVIAELNQAPAEESAMMFQALAKAEAAVVRVTAQAEALGQAYLEAGVLPQRRLADALHIAVATCSEVDYRVSWNHRHMTRQKKRVQYGAVNLLQGFSKTPFICNPLEACDDLRTG